MKIIKPILLGYQEKVSSEEGWIYEPKYDGIRLIVGNSFSYTRHGTTNRFPELLFSVPEVLLDGELIAPGTIAPDDFEGVMSRFSGNKEQEVIFMAFDIIAYKNETITSYPLEERKGLLTEALSNIDSIYFNLVPYIYTEGEAVFNLMKENKMEGIVAKRLNTPYLSGKRTDNWRKIINWSYHDCIVSKVTYGPLSVQLISVEGDYLGSVRIGFTKEIKDEIQSRTPPYVCKVKARGCHWWKITDTSNIFNRKKRPNQLRYGRFSVIIYFSIALTNYLL
ncbi:ATP-dependent DNA ligase [Psychrobacillus sp. FSL K6-1415]|uniref:ATP-dependent DNA ligase n=1 Tax=Psychrobacillus sp. FSL K6-1415 TaxID=2921544 RepID=UPI0030FD14D2